jgi:MFS family permease
MNTWTPAENRVLFRFSLYGFLKDQVYFEPFLILALLEKGLSFFVIGLLIASREFWINVFEVPSGAVADLYGRRFAMIFSHASYVVSFMVLAVSSTLWHLFAAMFFFALGEAFRTGTHKAMIFDWLRSRGRANERTRVYGYTRSWSKVGAAVSALIAAGLVFWTRRYSDVFWLCIIPYAANVVNFIGYPRETEADRAEQHERARVGGSVWHALKEAWHNLSQRRLMMESAGFEGTFEVAKDYLQPTIKTAALALPLLPGLEASQRTALLVGAVYCVLNLVSSVASRQAHRLADWRGGDDAAAHSLWIAACLFYTVLAVSLFLGASGVAIAAFVLLYLAQNLWRPALVSRINACSDPALAATTLSIESQAKSFFAMALAPLLGLAADHLGLWPVGLCGATIALLAAVLKWGQSPIIYLNEYTRSSK